MSWICSLIKRPGLSGFKIFINFLKFWYFSVAISSYVQLSIIAECEFKSLLPKSVWAILRNSSCFLYMCRSALVNCHWVSISWLCIETWFLTCLYGLGLSGLKLGYVKACVFWVCAKWKIRSPCTRCQVIFGDFWVNFPKWSRVCANT